MPMMTISAEMVKHFPRVDGNGDFAILCRDRSDEFTLFLFDSEDNRDMQLSELREMSIYVSASPYNVD